MITLFAVGTPEVVIIAQFKYDIYFTNLLCNIVLLPFDLVIIVLYCLNKNSLLERRFIKK